MGYKEPLQWGLGAGGGTRVVLQGQQWLPSGQLGQTGQKVLAALVSKSQPPPAL